MDYKIKPILLTTSAGITATLQEFISTYLYDSGKFIIWLVIAVTLDLLTGIAKVWNKEGHKAVTSKGIRMTVTKFIQYGSFIIITHVLANVAVGSAKPFEFVKNWAYTLLLLVEIKSVYENITAIDNRVDFIKPLLSKLGDFIKSKSKLDNNEKSNTEN